MSYSKHWAVNASQGLDWVLRKFDRGHGEMWSWMGLRVRLFANCQHNEKSLLSVKKALYEDHWLPLRRGDLERR